MPVVFLLLVLFVRHKNGVEKIKQTKKINQLGTGAHNRRGKLSKYSCYGVYTDQFTDLEDLLSPSQQNLIFFIFIFFIVLFAINCTNQIRSNYFNSHGEEAQEKPPGLQGMGSLSEIIRTKYYHNYTWENQWQSYSKS